MLVLLNFIWVTLPVYSTQASSSLSPTNPPRKDMGFIAPLIHQTSPRSPFYNPNATREDLQRESSRLSAARNSYFSGHSPDRRPSYLAPLSHDFVMQYSIGTPPVQVYGLPDTASDLIWLQCQPCTSCYNQIGPIYDSRKSSTYRDVFCASPDCPSVTERNCSPEDKLCNYAVLYEDQSYSEGVIAKETFTYMNTNVTVRVIDLLFGCGTYNSDTSGQGSPGAVGLRNGSSTLSLVGQLKTLSFSYCYTDGQSGDIRFGSEALLNLGESTPLLPNNYGNYHLILEGINVGGEQVNFSEDFFRTENGVEETGFVIDTGTTYSLLYSEAYNEFVAAIKESMAEKEAHQDIIWELCYLDITDAPEIEFQFTNMTLPISDQNAWIIGPRGLYCLAIQRTPNRLSTLGIYQQSKINVGFDLTNSQLWMQYQNYCPEK